MGMFNRTVIDTVGVALVLLGAATSANATDQGITGKKLLLKSTPKLVLLSKDPGISIAASDPIGNADSSITFDDGSGPVTLALPKAGWSTNGPATLFKYKNASAPGGPSVVKVAKVKPGLLKVVAKGLPFAVPNGAATIHVALSLDGRTNAYCMTFSGTGDGSRFLVKDAAAGTCAFPNSTVVLPTEGFQINKWVGSPGQTWELCYRKTLHGADSTTFHTQCDGRGPSVTVARLNNGLKIGGYASESWTVGGGYITSSASFLFSLTNSFQHALLIPMYSMLGAASYGPTFGGGHDWYIDSAISGGYCNFGHTYACRVGSYGSATCEDDFCGSYSSWSIDELEVWVLP